MKKIQEDKIKEESLDNPNWDEMRDLGKQMIDDMVDYLESISQKDAWQAVPEKTKNLLDASLPKEGSNPQDIYKEFSENILPFHGSNIHPRYWSWVQGGGSLFGAYSDFLASIMNPNVAIGDQAALYVENQVLDWSKEIMGYPKSASGILLSGGSIANITALMVARNSFANLDIRKKGLQQLPNKMVFYCSSETHACLQKAAEAMGLGSDAVIKMESDADYKIRIDHLKERIIQDKQKGLLPFAIVGNAGTVNTGAIDDLKSLYEISREHNLWFHIDGAYGAAAILSDEYKEQLEYMSLADSIAFDFHKWFYVNYEVGCLLVREGDKHRDAFKMAPNYLVAHDRGLAAGPESFNNYGMELSRGFKALKIWMLFKENGIEKYKRLITQNIDQAKYLESLISKEDGLELISPATLSIVCYRYNPGNFSEDELNNLNKNLLMELHEQGIATPSYTVLNGKYVIRVCNVNHRTKRSDLEILVRESLRIAKEL